MAGKARGSSGVLYVGHEQSRSLFTSQGQKAAFVAYESVLETSQAHKPLEVAFPRYSLFLAPLCEAIFKSGSTGSSAFWTALQGISAAADTVVCVVPGAATHLASLDCTLRYSGEQACPQCVLDQWNRFAGLDPHFDPRVVLGPGPVMAFADLPDPPEARRFLERNPQQSGFAWTGESQAAADGSGPIAIAMGQRLGTSAAPLMRVGRHVLLAQISGAGPSDADIEDLCKIAVAATGKTSTGPIRHAEYRDDDLLTSEEIAGFLRVAEGTIRNWVSSGSIPYVKLGGFVRFRWKDLKKWFDSRSAGEQGGDARDEKFPWSK